MSDDVAALKRRIADLEAKNALLESAVRVALSGDMGRGAEFVDETVVGFEAMPGSAVRVYELPGPFGPGRLP